MDDLTLEPLVERAAAGDELAWADLWEAIEPRLLPLIGTPRFLGPLSRGQDDARNVMVEVMARLLADDFRRLRMYCDKRASRPDMRFMPWLLVVAKRVAIDYIRAHDQYIDRRHARGPDSAPGKWVSNTTLPAESRLGGARPPMTRRGAALELASEAGRLLSEPQRAALSQWIQSESFAAIAHALELESSADAERLVRAGLQRLRRQVRRDENDV